MPVSDDDINAALAQSAQKKSSFDADMAEAAKRPMPGRTEFSADEAASMRVRPSLSDLGPAERPALPNVTLDRPSLKDLGNN